MPKRRVGVIDLVNNTAVSRNSFTRLQDANQSNIMTEVVAVWCEQAGHRVTFLNSAGELPGPDRLAAEWDVVIISAFTRSAQLAYALGHFFRSRGIVAILGGPHARAYPQDAAKYFDYVVGFASKELVHDLLQDCSRHPSGGVYVSANGQPPELPGVRERWKFIEAGQSGNSRVRMVHMIASLGCPYRCSFCSDAEVKYQTLDFETIREDLRFLRTKYERPAVAWDDPNFGIRFGDYMDAIEAAVPPNTVDFLCHTSLSVLTERNLPRFQQNGFKGVMPGIESWYDMGEKSKSAARKGMEKVRDVAQRVNLVTEYIPYVQTNLILGLDTDDGQEPFELTREFIALVPKAVPYVTLITAFGHSAPLNERYRRERRVLPFPFHFLNNSHVSNIKLKNYTWPDFFDCTIAMRQHIFSPAAIARRFRAHGRAGLAWVRWANLLRAISSERQGKTKRYIHLRRLLDTDAQVRDFWDNRTTALPPFYLDCVRRDLGVWWEWLPEGGLYHDPYGPFEAADQARARTRLQQPRVVARPPDRAPPVGAQAVGIAERGAGAP